MVDSNNEGRRRRAYRLGRRAEAAEETRRRIVEATAALHAEQGIARTSMKDIAARAEVSVGTVYHHFPTYEDAVRACGAHTQRAFPPPTEEVFAGVAERPRRVKRLAAAYCAFYERLPALARVRCDQDAFPVLREFLAAEERHRRAVTARAIDAPRDDDPRVETVAALLDLSTYEAFRRLGASREAAAKRMAGVANAWLDRDG